MDPGAVCGVWGLLVPGPLQDEVLVKMNGLACPTQNNHKHSNVACGISKLYNEKNHRQINGHLMYGGLTPWQASPGLSSRF